VPGPEIVPFADEHVEAAAALLAERHARHRTWEPLLPADVDFRSEVETARGEGAVALHDGVVAAYLLGERRENEVFGRHIWIDRAGCGAQEPELVRDLYAHVAQGWVDAGHARHFALAPAVGAELEPWRHQAASPVFAGVPEPPPDEVRTDWTETLEDAEVAYFLAERDGRLVGHVLVYPAGPGLGTPERALNLAIAATLPEERGTGVGVALTEHALAWARAQDRPTLVADWRVTNLLSSRFFPRRGFRVAFERLYRSIP
jgi:ribosomal protein S18 acetylase RimI-like enzyme